MDNVIRKPEVSPDGEGLICPIGPNARTFSFITRYPAKWLVGYNQELAVLDFDAIESSSFGMCDSYSEREQRKDKTALEFLNHGFKRVVGKYKKHDDVVYNPKQED